MIEQLITLHPWLGKLFGAMFGYLMAGPAGALFGILVGNFFDKGLSKHLNNPMLKHYRQAPKEIKNLYFSITFKVMGHIAKADGHVSQSEINFTQAIMKEFNLHPRERQLARDYFNQGKAHNFRLDSNISMLLTLCRDNPALLQLFTSIIYRLSIIGGMNDYKRNQMHFIYTKLGFEPIGYQVPPNQGRSSNYSRHSAHQAPRPTHHFVNDYQLLGITSLAGKKEIKAAYRKKISRCHPDRLIAQNASKADIQAATEKAQHIQAAYERIKKIKGF